LGLEIFDLLYIISNNMRTRESRSFIARETRHISNSSQVVALTLVDELLGLAHGNMAF
jgi:hypothetical protein